MRYIGSKVWCLGTLYRLVKTELPSASSLCDPFAGTCTVPAFFKRAGFRVATGDILRLSYVFQVASIRLNATPPFARLLPVLRRAGHRGSPVEVVIDALNSVPPRTGWVTRNFSLGGHERRKFFTVCNARRIDATRCRIRAWKQRGFLSAAEHQCLLAALLEAVDRVANTAGTYYAFLRTFYRKANTPFRMRAIEPVPSGKKHAVYWGDACRLVSRTRTDVLYLDPPYNERDYAAYYHVPEMLAREIAPRVRGRSARAVCRHLGRSRFNSRSTAAECLRKVVMAANASLLILHYSTHGLVDHEEIMDCLKERGSTRWMTWRCRRYSTKRGCKSESQFPTRVYVCHLR